MDPAERPADQRPPASEAGFTLVEVVVALVLVGIIATSALSFTINGVARAASLQQRQTATAVANQAVEQVRAVTAVSRNGLVSGLVKGRNPVDVDAQWRGSAVPALSDTWQASDALAPVGSDQALVPLVSTTTVGSTAYTVRTFIGSCYRLRSATADAPCTRQAVLEPLLDPTYVRMARVVVQVSWTPTTASSCSAGGCSYAVSTLVDPHGDLTWNSSTRPVAVDDSASTAAGRAVTISVLGNDTGSPAPSGAVSIKTAPTRGSVAVNANGTVTYTPPPAGTWTVTFTYTFKSSDSIDSNEATVTVAVDGPAPVASDFSVDVPASAASSPAAVDLAVLSHVSGADPSDAVATVVNPAVSVAGKPGTVAASGGSVFLTPQSQSIGKRTFTYSVTSQGKTSNTATVTARVVPQGSTMSATAKAGSPTYDAGFGTRDVPSVYTGQMELLDWVEPAAGCGYVSQRPRFEWTPPSQPKPTGCTITYRLRGTAAGTTDMIITSTINLSATR